MATKNALSLTAESGKLLMSDFMERRGPAVEPREIMQEGEGGLKIAWADERVCHFNAPDLRRACPCAQCVNEWTGQRMLKPEAISDQLSIDNIAVVGRYALNFRWSDGHETGIYSFRYLRELCEQQERDEG
ncbi:MAG TPA: DUF971 domain-containing protein [Pyrinomonadaceae bacterium]